MLGSGRPYGAYKDPAEVGGTFQGHGEGDWSVCIADLRDPGQWVTPKEGGQ